MKTVKIKTLRLKNFKGIKDFTLDSDGKNIAIFGRNETGKSTVADGFFYLLFGKDSHDKADFQLKPVDESGNEKHHLETEVEAVLDVSGKSLSLMKRFQEKWTKKRGAATEEFTGHTTDHFIDGVPVKMKDYANKIGDVVDINAFKLVTNPYEFASLHWTARRQILLEMCGDVSDQDVLEQMFPAVSDKDKYNNLCNILNDCGIDDHKAKVKAGQKRINDELKSIPVRISERLESIKDAEKPDQAIKHAIESDLTEAREELRSLKANEALSKKRVMLNEINAKISKASTDAEDQARKAKQHIQEEIDKLETERREASGKISDLQDQVKRDENRNKISKESIDQVRSRWHEENDKQPSGESICPYCGHDLPEEQVAGTIATFNRLKADRLEKISAEGKTLKKNIEAREKDITAARLSIDTLEKKIAAINKDISEYKSELENISVCADIDDLEKEKDAIESEINSIESGSADQEAKTKTKIVEIQSRLDKWSKANAEWEASEKSRARIAELEQQEKELASEYERLESEIFMIEKFIVKKVELLEDQINSRFNMAKFKMFREQINGGIDECCEILYNGVPFDKGLNNAARINTGLDIVDTLSEYYGFSAPVFVDNAEGVNQLLPINSQVISLSVSDDDELTIKN